MAQIQIPGGSKFETIEVPEEQLLQAV